EGGRADSRQKRGNGAHGRRRGSRQHAAVSRDAVLHRVGGCVSEPDMMKALARTGVLTALLACVASTAFATDFVVTKTADTNDGVCDSDCSLREAITEANLAGDASVIVLGSGLTYALSSGVLHITSSLAILGNGS